MHGHEQHAALVAGKQWFYLQYQKILQTNRMGVSSSREPVLSVGVTARKTTKAEQERSLRAMAAVLSSSLANLPEDG